jgi:protein O-GlcNAc transferase
MMPPEFLRLLSMSRLLLDPFPFGGGVTTLEALAFGTPVVTLPSEQSVPRLAEGMVRAMGGVPGLVAQDEGQYVSLAVDLLRNATWREAVAGEILDRKHRLYSSGEAVGEWSRFLRNVVGGSITKTDVD